ncbi:MarR family transcriptional regulator [Streptomyces cellostaticus]|uniref:MarR family transcriptional regulator n=1 Tax=Streptomyces cellostaticus TaxID=67285 RepID=A0A101NM22_9ACTN|nr:MarR family winged helix-turn-helix transcriptional regulator [Streptomyces cellostaticus]KUM95771.1 MarR family transcriptional regulator [Streptomyces cellostaticus]
MTGDASTDAQTTLTSRLGYLLKHVHLRFTEASAQALAPFGVDGRELAVLAVLAADRPLSQMEAAGRISVDRTTMVALVDTLEGKGLVARRRSTEDRRRNTVQPTPEGQELLREAELARAEAERRFLAALSDTDTECFLRALRTLAGVQEQNGPVAR